MATKPRRIQVDSRAFFWKVDRATASTVRLRIWIEGIASKPWAEVCCRFDDPWINFKEMASMSEMESEVRSQPEPLGPRRVAEIIRMVIHKLEVTSEADHHRRFELMANGVLAHESKDAL